jgi:acetyl-CoA carboxylase, biotin carboxylase subunit
VRSRAGLSAPPAAELLDNPEFVSGDYDTGLVSRMRQA